MKRLCAIILSVIITNVCYSQGWTLASGIPSGINIYSASFCDGISYAVGYSGPNNGSTIFRSSNNGAKWELLCKVPDIMANVIWVNSNRIILSGYAYDNYVVCYSDDSGETWSQSQGLNKKLMLSSICQNNGLLYAVCGMPGSFALYESKDNGRNWQSTFAFPSECDVVNFIASSKGMMSASILNDDGASIVYSTNFGQSWALSNVKNPLRLVSGFFGTNNSLYAVGQSTDDNSNSIIVSLDGGKTFDLFETLPNDIIMVHSISTLGDTIFVVASDSSYALSLFYKQIN